jgi:hypothetical protein
VRARQAGALGAMNEPDGEPEVGGDLRQLCAVIVIPSSMRRSSSVRREDAPRPTPMNT